MCRRAPPRKSTREVAATPPEPRLPMRLRSVKRHWNEFARTDPLWAVLSRPDKRGNRWEADEFFRTGKVTVEADLALVERYVPALQRGTALDFGCGVGRLTQALADHFGSVVGVDISAEMLEHARRFNRHGGKVEYRLNTADDLRLLPDDRFDFVYSLITLQHIAPAYALRYIAEFVRVTAPGGAILFQVPYVPPAKRAPTFWPDTLLKRWWRDLRRRFRPVMEMHAIPITRVEQVLAEAGATLVHRFDYDAAGPELRACGYLAVKPARS